MYGSRLALHVAANEEARASDRSSGRTRTAYARGRTVSAYFRNHLTPPSGVHNGAYFRLAGQLSQLCAQTLHIFAYYPVRRARAACAAPCPCPCVGPCARAAPGGRRVSAGASPRPLIYKKRPALYSPHAALVTPLIAYMLHTPPCRAQNCFRVCWVQRTRWAL